MIYSDAQNFRKSKQESLFKISPNPEKIYPGNRRHVTNMGHMRLENFCRAHFQYPLKSHKGQEGEIPGVPGGSGGWGGGHRIKFTEGPKPFVLLW